MAPISYFFLVWLVYFLTTMQGSSAITRNRMVTSRATSNIGIVDEKIPEECEAMGYCEFSTNHPKQLATKLTQELVEARVPLDSDVNGTVPSITNRFNLGREATCDFTTQTVIPLMIRDVTDGVWYYTVNTKDQPIQKYNVQICKKPSSGETSSECSNVITLNDDYDSRCIQKYITRKVQVVKNGKVHPILGHIPCCCTCVAINRY